MKTHRTWASWAFVVVASSTFCTGCLAESDPVDIEQFDDIGYATEEAYTEEPLEDAGEDSEEETNTDNGENSGLCGPKCTKI